MIFASAAETGRALSIFPGFLIGMTPCCLPAGFSQQVTGSACLIQNALKVAHGPFAIHYNTTISSYCILACLFVVIFPKKNERKKEKKEKKEIKERTERKERK